jgi:hypothetical protein
MIGAAGSRGSRKKRRIRALFPFDAETTQQEDAS